MKTLFDKIYDAHVVKQVQGGPNVLYIDRHYIHEVTSPVAFLGLKNRGLKVFRPDQTTATPDHNVPTENQHLTVVEELSRNQLETLQANCAEHGIMHHGLGTETHGVVHIIGPELGLTQPGMTIVCGDSHTSTHGAFGSIAFGIGTSEIEMVFASQCIMQPKPKTMRITVNGELGAGVTAKDMALYIIAKISTSGGTGHFIEYAGSAVKALTMEGRMTLCNMSIECGARGGMVAPDETTFNYVKQTPNAPKGAEWEEKLAYWKTLKTDEGASFDTELTFDAADIQPMITYGTNPGMGVAVVDAIPSGEGLEGTDKATYLKSLEYMEYKVGEAMSGKKVDYVFVGSCTNGRIEDFRQFAEAVKGKQKAKDVVVWLVPGSKGVARQIIAEGLDKIYEEAGMKLRQPGCSACLAMNEDKIPAGKYSVSTSNRNFEGRQGPGARTMLASPLTAAAAAITGVITDPRSLTSNS
ncbi:MAG: 3-isopropylmalate dehydratase large subunit [Mangrovibacterium sp.]